MFVCILIPRKHQNTKPTNKTWVLICVHVVVDIDAFWEHMRIEQTSCSLDSFVICRLGHLSEFASSHLNLGERPVQQAYEFAKLFVLHHAA